MVDSNVKIRWLNPIGFSSADEPMGAEMNDFKRADTELEIVSLGQVPVMDNLEYRCYEALVYGDIIRVARDSAEQGFDAMIIGCFYDLALEDAREISGDTVIVAPCQASVQIAANLCNKFSVIVGQHKWIEQMTERVNRYGYQGYLASMRSIDIKVQDLHKDTNYTIERIIEVGRQAIEEDHAEALILGCTCSFGLYKEVQEELGVPVIDPMVAAVKMAEHLAALKKQFAWSPSRKWSCAPPPEEQLKQFSIFADPVPIGNKLTYGAS